MPDINQLITQIRTLPDCRVQEPTGLPQIDETKHILPDDIKEFYLLCGGAVLFENQDYPIYILPPEQFVLANPVIVGEICEEDLSSNWYIICNEGSGEYITVDLNPQRLGLIYDSFSDRHAVEGESQVIACSFTELLERLINNQGQYWFWLEDEFESLGDAYGEIHCKNLDLS